MFSYIVFMKTGKRGSSTALSIFILIGYTPSSLAFYIPKTVDGFVRTIQWRLPSSPDCLESYPFLKLY